MKPDPAAPVEQLHLLRQQLILAQVRIMELEDARDELQPKLAALEQLLQAAQALADAKLDEAAHLEKIRADLQGQYDHMRHLQHVANETLEATRAELAQASGRLAAAEQRAQQLQKELVDLAAEAARLQQSIDRLGVELAEATTLAATRLDRINQLDGEVRGMKASRSWRWTRWLRSLERTFGSSRKP